MFWSRYYGAVAPVAANGASSATARAVTPRLVDLRRVVADYATAAGGCTALRDVDWRLGAGER